MFQLPRNYVTGSCACVGCMMAPRVARPFAIGTLPPPLKCTCKAMLPPSPSNRVAGAEKTRIAGASAWRTVTVRELAPLADTVSTNSRAAPVLASILISMVPELVPLEPLVIRAQSTLSGMAAVQLRVPPPPLDTFRDALLLLASTSILERETLILGGGPSEPEPPQAEISRTAARDERRTRRPLERKLFDLLKITYKQKKRGGHEARLAAT